MSPELKSMLTENSKKTIIGKKLVDMIDQSNTVASMIIINIVINILSSETF